MSKRGKIAIGGADESAEKSPAATERVQNAEKPTTSPQPNTQIKPDPPSNNEQTANERTANERTAKERTANERGTKGERAYDPPPRRPRHERKNAFDLSAWLIEGVLGIAEEVRHNDLGLSEEFWTHAYAARREALLAARALIDTAIERCEDDDEKQARRDAGRRQRGRVNIKFD